MPAVLASDQQRQRLSAVRRAIRSAAAIETGIVAMALTLFLALPAQAQDDVGGAMQIASVSGAQNALPFQLGMPPRPSALDADLKVLLAQNRPHTKTDAAVDDETILVALALSVPQSVDEEIAKQYGLELVERTELPELDLRILTMRASGNTPTGPILGELRNDQRIRRAQYSAEYHQPSQGSSAFNRLNGPAEEAKAETVQRQPDRKGPAVAKVARKLAEQEPANTMRSGRSFKGEPVNQSAQPLRVGRVGDILSGGL